MVLIYFIIYKLFLAGNSSVTFTVFAINPSSKHSRWWLLICFNSDVDEEQEDFDINVDFVDFIKKNKHYVSQITQGVSDVFLTSARLTALQSYSSDNGSFINAAKTEQRVILENFEEIIGSDLSTYTEELKTAIKKGKNI